MTDLAVFSRHPLPMYSKHRHRRVSTIFLSAVCSGFVAPIVLANSIQLSVVPDKCISLLKGQTCYQSVQFRWNSQDTNSTPNIICLWREGDSAALTCWENVSEGKYRYSLEAAETTNFYLVVGKEQQPVIDRTTVKISWVYSNRESRRSRWRLF